jgi:hypothetical protein
MELPTNWECVVARQNKAIAVTKSLFKAYKCSIKMGPFDKLHNILADVLIENGKNQSLASILVGAKLAVPFSNTSKLTLEQ